jgi:hypothetical protein
VTASRSPSSRPGRRERTTGEHTIHARTWHEHLLLSGVFVLSRVALALAGLGMNFELDWMFLSEPRELQQRLFQTLYYFHAYPPGMNALTGVLLKLGGSHAALFAELLFCALGLLLVNALLFSWRAFSLPPRARLLAAAAFCLIPQALYFEHLYLYEHLVAALLCFAGALLFVAVRRRRAGPWLAFFTVCGLIGLFRSTYHLTWFAGMLALALLLTRRRHVRALLIGAAGPGVVLLALYLKNWALFGVFGATSAGGGNLTHVTVARLPEHVRDAWVKSGKLSAFATRHVYAPPGEYLDLVPASHGAPWVDVPALSALEKTSFHSANFNHWAFLDVNRHRRDDALTCITSRPTEYASTVWSGLIQLFGPSTRWHPRDKGRGSPHFEHRRVLGGYEAAYNTLLHRLPFAPVGLYVLLPWPLVWIGRRTWVNARSRVLVRRARAALLGFSLLQIVYLVVTSALFTIGESARYRYQVEPQIWLAVTLWAGAAWSRLRSRRARARG